MCKLELFDHFLFWSKWTKYSLSFQSARALNFKLFCNSLRVFLIKIKLLSQKNKKMSCCNFQKFQKYLRAIFQLCTFPSKLFTPNIFFSFWLDWALGESHSAIFFRPKTWPNKICNFFDPISACLGLTLSSLAINCSSPANFG